MEKLDIVMVKDELKVQVQSVVKKGDRGRVKGDFILKIIDAASGTVLDETHDHNLVVQVGKTNLSKLLGGDVAGVKVSKISVGTNGTAPVTTDTALVSPFTKAIDAVSFPDASSVRFSFTILSTEANGKTVREFGLLDDNNGLFSRKNHADIVKTSSIILSGTWIITFV